MTREEAIIELKKKITCTIGGLSKEEYNATIMAIEALQSEPNMIPIKLEKRYPESRDEDITDAFMQGYLKGKADRPQGEWIESELDKGFRVCSVCKNKGYKDKMAWRTDFIKSYLNFCPNCGAIMGGANDVLEGDRQR